MPSKPERFEPTRLERSVVAAVALMSAAVAPIPYLVATSDDRVWAWWALGWGLVAAAGAYAAIRYDSVELDREGAWLAGRREDTLVRWTEVADIRERRWPLGSLTLIDRDGRGRLTISGPVAESLPLVEQLLRRAELRPVAWKGRRFPPSLPTLVVSYANVRGIRCVTLGDGTIEVVRFGGRTFIDRDEVMRIQLAEEWMPRGGQRRFVRLQLTRHRTLDLKMPGSAVDVYRAVTAWRRAQDDEAVSGA